MNQSKPNFAILLLLIASLFTWVHCATLGKKPAYPAAVDSAMKTAFNQAESEYYRKRYDTALTAYKKYLEDFPYNQLADEAHYKIGKIHFIRQAWNLALESFQILASKSPDPVYRAKANFMSGYTAFEAGDLERASRHLDRVQTDRLPGSLLVHHYSMLLRIADKSGSKEGADYATLKLIDAYQQTSDMTLEERGGKNALTRREAEARLKGWITRPMAASELPGWMHSYPKGLARGYVDYKLGKTYFESGNPSKASKHLLAFIHASPKNEYASHARSLLEKLGANPNERPTAARLKVGVLLPLSGPNAGYGETTLNGIKCAAGLAEGCLRELASFMDDKPEVELIVRDTGVNPEAISKLVDELVHDDDVQAIIGPMSASLAEVASKRAQQLKVVMLAMTQKSDLMAAGDFIFQMGYEVDQQVGDLVQESLDQHFKTYGILYPNNSYGQELAALFEQAVKSSGGTVVTKAAYAPGSSELTGAARQLRLNINRYSFTDNSAGFEALFIPDSYAMVNRLIPVLQNVNVRGVALLGTNAWNDPNLSAELSQSYPGSFFVDLFHKGGNSSFLQQFVRGYLASYARTPTSIEALGFDAVWFLRRAAQQTGENKSGRLKEALLGMRNLEGVTGITSFMEEEGPQVSPFVLTSGPSGIELAP